MCHKVACCSRTSPALQCSIPCHHQQPMMHLQLARACVHPTTEDECGVVRLEGYLTAVGPGCGVGFGFAVGGSSLAWKALQREWGCCECQQDLHS